MPTRASGVEERRTIILRTPHESRESKFLIGNGRQGSISRSDEFRAARGPLDLIRHLEADRNPKWVKRYRRERPQTRVLRTMRGPQPAGTRPPVLPGTTKQSL